MEVFIRLPKDIQYLINDYLKDPTNYRAVVDQFRGLVMYSMDWMYKPNLDNVVKFMFAQRRKDIITHNNVWYDQIKKLKKPHGKRPPTIRSDTKKYELRFGSKNMYRFGRRKRPQTYFSFLFKAHKFIGSLLDQNGYSDKRITRKNSIC